MYISFGGYGVGVMPNKIIHDTIGQLRKSHFMKLQHILAHYINPMLVKATIKT